MHYQNVTAAGDGVLSPLSILCVTRLVCSYVDLFLQVDLRHMDEKQGSNIVEVGVDLSEFYMSVEWDILEVPAVR